MNARKIALGIVGMTIAAQMGAASAVPTHCAREIGLAGRTVAIAPIIGASISGPQMSYQSMECSATDSRLVPSIKPGSNSLRVLVGFHETPTRGTLTFAERTYELTFGVYTPGLGDPAGARWASGWHYFDPFDALEADKAEVVVCKRRGELEFCQHETFYA